MTDSELQSLANRISNLERAVSRQSERELVTIPQIGDGTIGDERFIRIGEEYRFYKKFPSGWKYSVMYISRPDLGPATALDELSDVTITAPSSGQVLKYGAGGAWINDTTPITNHDLTSAYHTAAGLTTGHFLKANGATSFTFAAHGLTNTDVGAEVSGATASHAALLTGIHGISITAGKVFSCSGTLTLAGTDGSTLTIGTGGTLGTAAYTASTAYAAAAHNHAGTEITSGTIDGDRLPAISTTKQGAVPLTGVASGKFLKDDGSWAAVAAGGDVTGASSSTDHEVVRFHSTTGKVLVQSATPVTISDAGSVNIPTGETYKINGSAHTHDHTSSEILNHGTYSHSNLDNHFDDTNIRHVPSETGNSGKVLGNNGTICAWQTAGAGDVVGPVASVDNEIARFHSTGGKTLQQSAGVTIDDSGTINIPTGQSYKINGTAIGVGDVGGPATSTDHAIARFDLTTGKILLNTGVTIDDSNVMAGVVGITSTGIVQVNKSGASIPFTAKLASGDSYVVAGLGTNGTVGVLYLNDDVTGAPWVVTADASGLDFGGARIETDGNFSVNGAAGATSTFTVVSAIGLDGGVTKYKTRSLAYSGGIITTVGAESGWTAIT